MSSETLATSAAIRAVRGAAQAEANTAEAIFETTARLLQALVAVNRLTAAHIVSAFFTLTEDLDAEFPAYVARRLGWTEVPMLSAREIPVPGAMPRLVRVLLTVAGGAPGGALQPVYLGAAAGLRPDLVDHTPRPEAAAAPGPWQPEGDGDPPVRLALIGLGQVGGSIGLSLDACARWHRVGCDADPGTAAAAFAAGAVDETAPTVASACAGARLAVIATPVDTLPALVEEAAAALPRGAALLDTGSARGPVTAALERAVARGIAAIGGHPIAGHEGSGFAAARAGMFDNALFALLPVDGAAPGIPEPVAALVRDLGARPRLIGAAAHDHALARTSHLPYLIACALRDLGGAAAADGLAGPGYRDMTRLAASDPRMAQAYCRANARRIAEAWRELSASLERRIETLSDGP